MLALGDFDLVLVGPDAKLIDLVSRLPAAIYQRVVVTGSKLRR